jgi:hypothetical protein
MASPFENLLQASQFAIQTRANYDQMAERRAESTANLMQRRAEQQQQNQQFLTEMNLKERQQKMQAEQFDATMAYNYARAQSQDKLAQAGIDLTAAAQKFRQEVEVPFQQEISRGQLAIGRGQLGLAQAQFGLTKQKFDLEMDALRKAQEAAAAGPITIDVDPGVDLASGYKDIQGIGRFLSPIGSFLAGPFADLGRFIGRTDVKNLSAELVSEDIVKMSKDIGTKVSQSISSGRPIEPNSLLGAYVSMSQAYEEAKGRMPEASRKRSEAAIQRVFSTLPKEVQQGILQQAPQQ